MWKGSSSLYPRSFLNSELLLHDRHLLLCSNCLIPSGIQRISGQDCLMIGRGCRLLSYIDRLSKFFQLAVSEDSVRDHGSYAEKFK